MRGKIAMHTQVVQPRDPRQLPMEGHVTSGARSPELATPSPDHDSSDRGEPGLGPRSEHACPRK